MFTSAIRMRLVPSNMFKPSSNFPSASFADPFLTFVFYSCLCHTVLSAPCSFIVTCRERADLLVLFHAVFSCVFLTFSHGVLGQVSYLTVSILDLFLLPYLKCQNLKKCCSRIIIPIVVLLLYLSLFLSVFQCNFPSVPLTGI